jgi:hypothetical protein
MSISASTCSSKISRYGIPKDKLVYTGYSGDCAVGLIVTYQLEYTSVPSSMTLDDAEEFNNCQQIHRIAIPGFLDDEIQ